MVSGYVFKDKNRDGKFNIGDTGLAGKTVFMVFIDSDGDGKLDPNELFAVTDGSGRYVLNLVTPGPVRLRLVTTGLTLTKPSPALYALTAGSGQVIGGKNFGVR